ncbi:MAG: hypothetical protein NVSMB69_13560 [Novosphingobium sp.]
MLCEYCACLALEWIISGTAIDAMRHLNAARTGPHNLLTGLNCLLTGLNCLLTGTASRASGSG